MCTASPENGGPTINGIKKIDEWSATARDVIHVKLGPARHQARQGRQAPGADRGVREEPRELVKKLKATKAKVIWASTTCRCRKREAEPAAKDADVVSTTPSRRR